MEIETANMYGALKVGFIVYSANTLQVNLLVKNFLAETKQEKGHDI